MIAVDIISDGLFAAIAAIGFGAISDPPMRAFPRISLLAAVGHALRYCLMHFAGFDIATASLAASFTIGMGSLWLGKGAHVPMTCLYIPALLPMVPGTYAYKTVFSLIMFIQSLDNPDGGLQYMQAFFLNATVSIRENEDGNTGWMNVADLVPGVYTCKVDYYGKTFDIPFIKR